MVFFATASISEESTQCQTNRRGWSVPPRYQLKQLVGRGSYGAVCEAFDVVTQKHVAIKKTKRSAVDSKCVLREIAILSEIRHENIVQVIDLITPDMRTFDELYIVMEMCDSDMRRLCAMNCMLPAHQINTLLYQLLVGLKYLHSAGIYHRDLKPANVLLNSDLSVKIADFGLSRAIGVDNNQSHACLGTPSGSSSEDDSVLRRKSRKCLTEHVVTRWYRGPELILLQQNYTEAIDIWSVGCIYAELLGLLDTPPEARRPLFPGASCFPLSPDNKRKKESSSRKIVQKDDQLNMIFYVLGTPSTDDIEELEEDDQKRYIGHFAFREAIGFKVMFPRVESNSVDMLEKMLRFSPSKRITVAQSLEHELFSQIREPKVELDAPSIVNLEFEKEPELDETLFLKYFIKEIQKYHPEIPELDVSALPSRITEFI